METTMRQTWAFLFRGYHLTRRYISWVIVFNFYALVTSATVALIGVAGDECGKRRRGNTYIPGLASIGFRRLLSRRGSSKMDAAFIVDIAGNLYTVRLPKTGWRRKQRISAGSSRGRAFVGSFA